MSEGKSPPFFENQEVVVKEKIRVTKNIFIEVDERSMIKLPENIERLLVVGAKGRIIKVNKDSVLLGLFPRGDSIRIWVKLSHFGDRFTAGEIIVWD